MQAAMSGMGTLAGYAFPQLTPTQLPYSSAPTQTVVPSTSTVISHPTNSVVKSELSVTNLTPVQAETKEAYEGYSGDSTNDVDQCSSSIRSSASPRSQEEHVVLAPFPYV